MSERNATGAAAPQRHRPFTDEELEAGIRSIDPANADVFWGMADVADPYGVGAGECGTVGRTSFVRAPANDIWIYFGDLPDALCEALEENLKAGVIPPRHLRDQKRLRDMVDKQLAATAEPLAAAWALYKERAADQTTFNTSFAAWLAEPLCKKHPNVDVEALVSVVGELLGPVDSVRWFTST